MSFPTIPTQTDGRVGFVNQLDSTTPLTGPNLNTLTKAPGDLLLAIAGEYQSNAGADAAYTGWAGGGLTWTEIRDSTGTADNRLGVAYARVVTGSETGTVTVTRSGTLVGDASMIVLVIPGTHPTTAPEATVMAVAANAAADPAALTPSWGAADTLWVGVNGNGMTVITGTWTANNAAPTNYTDYFGTAPADTSTVGDFGLAVAFRQLNAASEDMGPFGQDTTNARSAALLIAVRPDPNVTVTAESATVGFVAADATVPGGPRQPPTLVDYQETTWAGNGAKSTPAVTWQAGDRIVVVGGASSEFGGLPVPTATGLTFTAGTAVSQSGTGWMNSWTATAAANGSATIDSAGTTGAGAWGMAVWAWRGSDGFGNRAAVGATTAKTVSLTRSQAESAVVAAVSDYGAGATTGYAFTPAPVSNEREVTATANWGIYVADWVDQDATGTTSYGITGTPSTANHTKLALEVLGTAAAGGTTANAAAATTPVAAADAAAALGVNAETASVPVTAADATGALAVQAGSATVSVTAADATVSATGAATANAQSASVPVVAADATVALVVQADPATTMPVTAADASGALVILAGTASIPVAAADATGSLIAQAGSATVGLAAADATVQTTVVAATVGIGAIRWVVAAAPGTVQADPATVGFSAADASVAVGVNAEAAVVAISASEGVDRAVTVDAGSAAMPVVAADAAAPGPVDAQPASVPLVAADASVALVAAAGSATVSVTAADATVSATGAATANAQSAVVSVTAADASVATAVDAGSAIIPVAAADAAGVVGALAGPASIPVAATDAASIDLVVSAGSATITVAAADATASTVAQTTASAEAASVPLSAGDATVAVVVSAGSAAMPVVAADATASTVVTTTANAEAASVPVAAADAGVAVVAAAGSATVGFVAADATFARFTDVNAQPAAVTVAAADAGAALGVVAGAALVPLVAADASVFIPPPVPPPRWVEGASVASGLVEGDSDSSGTVEGVLVGAGIVEGSSSL